MASHLPSPLAPRRRVTRAVGVGDVWIGGDFPVRIQSMTTTDTRATAATVAQAVQLVEAGCEIIRITAPSIRDAENLANIKAELHRRGIETPLVADIHFTPNAAMEAALHVEKVRINPGNFADKKRFAVREYSDAEYAREIERVAARFRPLVRRCRELGRAMRIGTNHGSLSDRIMNRFGDTPEGMVESAIEFLDVCEDEGFLDIVFSMKSSNARVAIEAYRLLAERLEARAPGEPSYPFHIGVTEAGDAEDGRIKSAIGIGALLEDGIGDTLRVSLTESPVAELPVAAALAKRCQERWRSAREPAPQLAIGGRRPAQGERRPTRALGPAGREVGGEHPVRVEVDIGPVAGDVETLARDLAGSLADLREVDCEGVHVEVYDPSARDAVDRFRKTVREAGFDGSLVVRAEAGVANACAAVCDRLVVPVGALAPDAQLAEVAAAAAAAGIPVEWELRGRPADVPELLDRALATGLADCLFSTASELPIHASRVLALALGGRAVAAPIVLHHRRRSGEAGDRAIVAAAVDLGAPLCDGIGDAVVLADFGEPARAVELAYRILQGARLRTTWTEFISCPSCGRTLFDLEETTARIKQRTRHLRGVKIAVMGCIVNGLGEMADADFGYVGSGPGLVNLYVGRELVVRNLPQAGADDRLVDLIRDHGRWQDPPEPDRTPPGSSS